MPRTVLKVLGVLLLCLGFVLPTTNAIAQQKSLKEELVGTWMAVSNITTRPDGTKTDTFGPNPKGIWVFDSNGHLAFITTASNLPKFSSNNRATGTADENKAVVQGSIAYIATYTVDEADKSFTMQIEGATFPNWAGTTQKRMAAISGDELIITNPAGSTGGTTESKWRRAK